MTDRERLLQTLAATYAYYERELSEFVLQVWMEDLEGYRIDAVCAAFTAHRRDPQRGQWLPKTADILRHLNGDEDDNSQLAWSSVMQIASNGGRGKLEDEAAYQAVRSLGGISVVQRADSQQLQWLQKRFIEAYSAFSRREKADYAALPFDALQRIAGAVKESA